MSDGATGSRTRPPSQTSNAAFYALLVGMTACAAAVVEGFAMILSKQVADCPDGAEFVEGTTGFDCLTQPQTGLGIGLVTLGFAVGAGLVLLHLVLTALRADRQPSAT